MPTLISLVLEVQIVKDFLQVSLADLGKHDLHIELAPSLLLDAEWRLSFILLRALAEGFVEMEDRFLEAVGGEELGGIFGVCDV